jgi:hypothetical protein
MCLPSMPQRGRRQTSRAWGSSSMLAGSKCIVHVFRACRLVPRSSSFFGRCRVRMVRWFSHPQTGGVLAGPNGAAARLGMNRSTLCFRMKKLGIERPAGDCRRSHSCRGCRGTRPRRQGSAAEILAELRPVDDATRDFKMWAYLWQRGPGTCLTPDSVEWIHLIHEEG